MPEFGPFLTPALGRPQLAKPVVLHGYFSLIYRLIPGNSELCRKPLAG